MSCSTEANFDSNGGSREELVEKHAIAQTEFQAKDHLHGELKLTLDVCCSGMRMS